MTDFTPTPEAVEAAVTAFTHTGEWGDKPMAEAMERAIAAFVEAEGFTEERVTDDRRIETNEPGLTKLSAVLGDKYENIGSPGSQRLVGIWRKRD